MVTSRQIILLMCISLLNLVLNLPTSVQAAPNQYGCSDKPLRVGYFKLGYRFYVENGHEKGMNVDILEEFKKRTGCSFTTQEMTFARIWADLASGQLDMSLSGIRSPERDKTLWCAESITSKNFVVIGPAAKKAGVRSGNDFLTNSKLVFGVVRGYTHGKLQDAWLEKMRQAGRVEESANTDILFEKLKEGRLDGIFSFPFVYRKLINELGLYEQVVVQDWFAADRGIIGCTMLPKSRFTQAEADQWQALIHKMQKDGTLKRIFTRYVTAAEADQMLDF